MTQVVQSEKQLQEILERECSQLISWLPIVDGSTYNLHHMSYFVIKASTQHVAMNEMV